MQTPIPQVCYKKAQPSNHIHVFLMKIVVDEVGYIWAYDNSVRAAMKPELVG